MRTIEKSILEIVYQTLGLQINETDVSAKISMRELGISSLEMVSLLFEFEEAFDVSIETEEMFALSSIKDVANFLNSKMQSNQSTS